MDEVIRGLNGNGKINNKIGPIVGSSFGIPHCQDWDGPLISSIFSWIPNFHKRTTPFSCG